MGGQKTRGVLQVDKRQGGNIWRGGSIWKTTERLNSVLSIMQKAGFRSITDFLCILFRDHQQANSNRCDSSLKTPKSTPIQEIYAHTNPIYTHLAHPNPV